MKISIALIVMGFTAPLPLLTGCAKTVVESVEEVRSDKLVARVASVHKKEGYALIQRYGRISLGDDAILYTLSETGATSNLKITGEKLGQFVAVDIVSGELSIGDGVYLRNLSNKAEIDNKESFTKDKS